MSNQTLQDVIERLENEEPYGTCELLDDLRAIAAAQAERDKVLVECVEALEHIELRAGTVEYDAVSGEEIVHDGEWAKARAEAALASARELELGK